MNTAMIVLFGTSSYIGAGMALLFIIGLWAMLRKSGIPGWWALIPCARGYDSSLCAGR